MKYHCCLLDRFEKGKEEIAMLAKVWRDRHSIHGCPVDITFSREQSLGRVP